MSLKLFVKTDAEGRIESTINCSGTQTRPEGFVEVLEREDRIRIRSNPRKARILEDGSVVLRKKVRLSLSGKDLVADGKDELFIEVKGLDSGESVNVRVGDRKVRLSAGDVHKTTERRPGSFVVKIDDPAYYNVSLWGEEPAIRVREVDDVP